MSTPPPPVWKPPTIWYVLKTTKIDGRARAGIVKTVCQIGHKGFCIFSQDFKSLSPRGSERCVAKTACVGGGVSHISIAKQSTGSLGYGFLIENCFCRISPGLLAYVGVPSSGGLSVPVPSCLNLSIKGNLQRRELETLRGGCLHQRANGILL